MAGETVTLIHTYNGLFTNGNETFNVLVKASQDHEENRDVFFFIAKPGKYTFSGDKADYYYLTNGGQVQDSVTTQIGSINLMNENVADYIAEWPNTTQGLKYLDDVSSTSVGEGSTMTIKSDGTVSNFKLSIDGKTYDSDKYSISWAKFSYADTDPTPEVAKKYGKRYHLDGVLYMNQTVHEVLSELEVKKSVKDCVLDSEGKDQSTNVFTFVLKPLEDNGQSQVVFNQTISGAGTEALTGGSEANTYLKPGKYILYEQQNSNEMQWEDASDQAITFELYTDGTTLLVEDTTPSKDKTFVNTPAQYEVKFELQGGKGEQFDRVPNLKYNFQYEIPEETPTLTDNIFCGWSETKNGLVKYHPGDTIPITENVTLYAQWIPAPNIENLLSDKITVKCTNEKAKHSERTYGAENGGYEKGKVENSNGIYTIKVTIDPDVYLNKFIQDQGGIRHDLVTNTNPEITFTYDPTSKTWVANKEVVIQTTCKDSTLIIKPENLTIYRGGEKTEENGSNYNIVNKNGDIMGNTGSLPEIGFSLQLSTGLNQKLHEALNVPTDQALDLAGRITLTAKTSDGNTTLEWELKHYGSEDGSSVTTTDKNGFYIYKIVPVGDSEGAKLNVSFINDKGDYVNTDAFEIEDNNNNLAATYKMMIYGDRVDASTLSATIKYGEDKTETVSVQGAEDPATLTVRYTNTDASITHSFDTVAEASKSEDQNDQSKLTQSAYMIRKDAEEKPVDSFMVNNSDVQVDGQDVSLLFDDIAETESTNYEDTLKTKAVDAVKDKNAGVDTSKLKTEAKYLDLVDATNGNVWVTTDDDVTIYWPFPEGTDASTTFYVAHFDGLDRDKDVAGMTTEVNDATATLMNVETDQYGVYFTTSSFSPYVLVWDTTKSSGGNGGNGGGGTTTTTTNNNNTNNNTTTVNVTSTAAAQPQAATAAIPQTGDAMPVGLLGGLAAAAAAGFAALFVIRKRKQNG